MSDFGFVDMKIKALFFDRPKVQRAVKSARRRALSKTGAFIRQRAKTSMRKVGKRARAKATPGSLVSRPGQPPLAHEGSLRRLLFFAYDPNFQSVVVGPLAFRAGTAPATLEYGGEVVINRRRRRRDGQVTRYRSRARILPRPYMAPALQKEIPGMPEAWRNSIKGA